jgi:isoleucyl-tRNA synthetase
VGEDVLDADAVLVEEAAKDGWAIARAEGVVVGIELELDEELIQEGHLFDLIHAANTLRKDEGFNLTDRVVLTIPRERENLLAHSEILQREVLADAVEVGDGLAVRPVTAG